MLTLTLTLTFAMASTAQNAAARIETRTTKFDHIRHTKTQNSRLWLLAPLKILSEFCHFRPILSFKTIDIQADESSRVVELWFVGG